MMKSDNYNGNEPRDKITYKEKCHICNKSTTIACDVYRFDGRYPICKKCNEKRILEKEFKCMNCDMIFKSIEKKGLCPRCTRLLKKIY